MSNDYPTARGVSAFLTRAGFTRSQTHGTRIKGLSMSSPGFSITRYTGTTEPVEVTYYAGVAYSDTERARNEEVEARQLKAMAEALREHGYGVEEFPDTDLLSLAVVSKPERKARK